VWAKLAMGMQVILTQAVWLVESSTVEFYGVGLAGDTVRAVLIVIAPHYKLMVESSTVEFYGVG